MRIAAIAFTRKGAELCSRLACLLSPNHIYAGYAKEKVALQNNLLPLRDDLRTWVGQHFDEDALLFIGAAGIAVRGIAPFLKGKDKDPAVLVMDEGGRFVIPILSGHIGGANRLAEEFAALSGAVPVITTATDVNGVFAVDEWAVRNGYAVENAEMIKAVSSALLEGELVGFYSEFCVKGALPHGLMAVGEKSADVDNGAESASGIASAGVSASENANIGRLTVGISISLRTNRAIFPQTLRLIPKCLYVGMGMKKGVSVDVLETLFLNTLKENHLSVKSVAGISTIELKKSEPALLVLCQKYKLPLYWYPAEVLSRMAGVFTSSAFVERVTGVDNVCERAAAAAAALAPSNGGSEIAGRLFTHDGDAEEPRSAPHDEGAKDEGARGADIGAAAKGRVIVSKHSFQGATIAIGQRDWIVEFS